MGQGTGIAPVFSLVFGRRVEWPELPYLFLSACPHTPCSLVGWRSPLVLASRIARGLLASYRGRELLNRIVVESVLMH